MAEIKMSGQMKYLTKWLATTELEEDAILLILKMMQTPQMLTELMDFLADEQTRDSQKILTKAMELYERSR